MECARNGTVNFGVPEQATDTFKRAFECPKRRVPSSFNLYPLNPGRPLICRLCCAQDSPSMSV
jgi:hypothetical protein